MTKKELLELRKSLKGKRAKRVDWTVRERNRRELATFVAHVPDPIARDALNLYLVRGFTWQAVAAHMGWQDEGSPRKLAARYLPRG